ncbi:MAG: T9SS type A sorting domain-containing protein, partial [candidate division Zixibacteria bacterium]|nr:T9SS type A sorting domain-containing protein [candidate division Zixibacteria bacterium]
SPVPSYTEAGGKLFTIYFSSEQNANSQISQIDTLNTVVNVGSGIVHTEQLVVSDDEGTNSYLLAFKPGIINIQIATAIDDDSNLGLPTEYSLTQNYPNPFNPTTTIEFSLPKASNVKLVVYNVLGQKVSSLIDEFMSAGVHSVEFDGKNNPSGIYFYRLEHEKGAETKKMVMIK